VLQAPACEGVHEAVGIYRAAARVGVCEDREALEAEPRVAVSAHHLVTLGPLRVLVLQRLLGDGHLAPGALLGTCLGHPFQKGLIGTANALFPQACSMLLAGLALMVRLSAALQA